MHGTGELRPPVPASPSWM